MYLSLYIYIYIYTHTYTCKALTCVCPLAPGSRCVRSSISPNNFATAPGFRTLASKFGALNLVELTVSAATASQAVSGVRPSGKSPVSQAAQVCSPCH